MPNPVHAVVCVPCDLSRLAGSSEHLQTIAAMLVTSEHIRIACGRCSEECWIGPSQLAYFTSDLYAEVVCGVCLLNNPVMLHALLHAPSGPIHALLGVTNRVDFIYDHLVQLGLWTTVGGYPLPPGAESGPAEPFEGQGSDG
jgi:hypothetical protein